MDNRVRSPLVPDFPILTALACAWCVIVFVGLQVAGPDARWAEVARWGHLPPGAIWDDGAYWTLLTSVFVHFEIWHLCFNLYWLWLLGGALEREVGSLRWLIFFVTAALVSSAAQLASGDMGIGMSGVGYALFGFLWIARDKVPAFRDIVTEQTMLVFMLWMFACIILTVLNVMAIGNEAHAAGLLFGIVAAELFVRKRRPALMAVALVAMLLAACVPLFWCPLSPAWNAHQAMAAHARNDYDAAVYWYHRSLERGTDEKWAWQNLAELHGYRGDKAAYAAALQELRKLDEAAAREVEADYGPAPRH